MRAREFGGEHATLESIAIEGGISGVGTLYSGDVTAIGIQVRAQRDFSGVVLHLAIHDASGQEIFGFSSDMLGCVPALVGGTTYQFNVDFRNDLAPGSYHLSTSLTDRNGAALHVREFSHRFSVTFISGFHFEGVVNLNPGIRVFRNGSEIRCTDKAQLNGLRIHGECTRELTEFGSDIRPLEVPRTLQPGTLFSCAVDVTNRSGQTWITTGAKPVQLGYRWFDPEQRPVAAEGLRTRLPRDLAPGQSVRIFVHVQAPSQPGHYRLRIAAVQEYVAWFDDRDGGCLELPLDVQHRDP